MITFIVFQRRFQMKILRILLILLMPALGFISCTKSGIKPSCNGEHHQTENSVSQPAASDDAAAPVSAGRRGNNPLLDEDKSTSLVGSGDDDRDGGDKKKKAK